MKIENSHPGIDGISMLTNGLSYLGNEFACVRGLSPNQSEQVGTVATSTTPSRRTNNPGRVICYDSPKFMRKPWVIAHRGASGHTPENTLVAFERAVQLGAGFIETDLHLTRDARFVAIHDATLERTTNGRGEVRDFTLAELRRLDAGMWYDREHMGQRIPTLEEILDFARKHDVIFYLEVKYDASWGMHHSLIAALQAADYAGRTIVISFDQATLAALRRVDPAAMMGFLVDEAGTDSVKEAIELGARQLCPKAHLVTRELVDQAHGADLQVATWTVDDPEEMRRVIGAGVDGVMTNFPDRLRAVIEDLQEAENTKLGKARE